MVFLLNIFDTAMLKFDVISAFKLKPFLVLAQNTLSFPQLEQKTIKLSDKKRMRCWLVTILA